MSFCFNLGEQKEQIKPVIQLQQHQRSPKSFGNAAVLVQEQAPMLQRGGRQLGTRCPLLSLPLPALTLPPGQAVAVPEPSN